MPRVAAATSAALAAAIRVGAATAAAAVPARNAPREEAMSRSLLGRAGNVVSRRPDRGPLPGYDDRRGTQADAASAADARILSVGGRRGGRADTRAVLDAVVRHRGVLDRQGAARHVHAQPRAVAG